MTRERISVNKVIALITKIILSVMAISFFCLLPALYADDYKEEEIARDLKSENSHVRRSAANKLIEFKTPRAVEFFIDALKSEDIGVRLDAIEAVGKLNDARAIGPLVTIMKNDDYKVQDAAAAALLKIKDSRVVDSLIPLLRDKNFYARGTAAELLGKIADARALVPLIDATRDYDINVQLKSIRSLGQLKDKRAVEPLINKLGERESLVKENAAHALGMIGDSRAVEPLIAALGYKGYDQHRTLVSVIKALGEIKNSRAAAPLVNALRNDSIEEDVRTALMKIGPPAVGPLIDALKDKEPNYRRKVVRTLSEFSDPGVIDPLISELTSETGIKIYAIWGLEKNKDPRVIDPLIMALKDKSASVRSTAAKALGGYTDLRAVEPLIAALNDDDRYVRADAEDALVKITGKNFGGAPGKWQEWLRQNRKGPLDNKIQQTQALTYVEVEKIDIVDYGIYASEASSEKKAAKTALGKITVTTIGDINLVEQTKNIPAVIGTKFGLQYIVRGTPTGKKVPVTVKVLHPVFQDPETGGEYFSDEWVSEKTIGFVTYDGYIFEKDWEMASGNWRFQLFYEGRKLAEKNFIVFNPADEKPAEGLKDDMQDIWRKIEKDAFEQALREDSVQSYQSFLARYPQNKYRKEAESRIMDITLYNKAASLNTIRAYQEYLSASHGGYKQKDALDRIETLEFEFYKKVDSIWGYDYFLKKYPGTKFIKEITKENESIRYEQVKQEEDIASYEKFLDEFPNGLYTGDVKQRLAGLKKERALLDEIASGNNMEDYGRFINLYPSSPFVKEARERIILLKIKSMFSVNSKSLHQPVLLSNNTSHIAKLYFKNQDTYPVTVYFAGKEIFSGTFNPGEAGTLEFLSGKYKIALAAASSPEAIWTNEINFTDEMLMISDPDRKEIGLIEVAQSITKYPVKVMPSTGRLVTNYPFASPEVLMAYNKEMEGLKERRENMVKSLYPLKRAIALKELLLLGKSMDVRDKLAALSGLSRIKNRLSFMALRNMLGDNEINKYVIGHIEKSKDVIWPLIALVKQASEKEDIFFTEGIRETTGFYRPRDENIFEKVNAALPGMDGAADAIAAALKYSDKSTYLNLLSILGDIAEEKHENIFLEALGEKENYYKVAATKGLANVATEKSIKPLLKALLEEDSRFIHENALDALKTLAAEGKLTIAVNQDNFEQFLKLYELWGDKLFFNSIPREKVEDSVLLRLDTKDRTRMRILCNMLSANGIQRDAGLLIQCLKSPAVDEFEGALERLVKLRDENTIDSMVELINSSNNNYTKEKAIETIGRLGTRKAVDKLLELLKTYKPDEDKRMVIKALGKTGSPDAAEILINMSVKYCDSAVYHALSSMGKVAVPALQRILDGNDEKAKLCAVDALQKIDGDSAENALFGALSDKSSRVRKEAVEALYRHEVFLRKKDAPYRMISALDNENTPNEDIIGLLGSKSVNIAVNAIKNVFNREMGRDKINYPAINALSNFGEKDFLKRAVPPIIALLKNENPAEDSKRIYALSKIGDERAVEPLCKILRQRKRIPEIIFALSDIGSQKAVLPLLELLGELKNDPKEFITQRKPVSLYSSGFEIVQTNLSRLVETLGKLKDERVVDAIINILHDRRMETGSPLHGTILRALSNIGGLKAEREVVREFQKIKSNYAFYRNKMFDLSIALSAIKNAGVVNDVLPIANEGDLEARKMAVTILGNIKHRIAIDALTDIILKSEDLSQEAALSLGKIGERALDDLLGLLSKVQGSKKRMVIYAIADIKSKKAIIPLIKAAPTADTSLIKDSLKKILSAHFPEFFIAEVSLQQISERLRQK